MPALFLQMPPSRGQTKTRPQSALGQHPERLRELSIRNLSDNLMLPETQDLDTVGVCDLHDCVAEPLWQLRCGTIRLHCESVSPART